MSTRTLFLVDLAAKSRVVVVAGKVLAGSLKFLMLVMGCVSCGGDKHRRFG